MTLSPVIDFEWRTYDASPVVVDPPPPSGPFAAESFDGALGEGWTRRGAIEEFWALPEAAPGTLRATLNPGEGYLRAAPATANYTVELELSAEDGRMVGPWILDDTGRGIVASWYHNPQSYLTLTATAYGYGGQFTQGPTTAAVRPSRLRLTKTGGSYTTAYSTNGGATWSAETPAIVPAGFVPTKVGFGEILATGTVTVYNFVVNAPDLNPPPEPDPDPVPVGWVTDLERSDALLSYAVTGYGRADATARTTPVQVSVALSAGVAGDPPQVGERFRLQLSAARAAVLGVTTATGAVRFTGEVTDHVHDPNAGPSGTYTVTGVGRLGRASRRRAQPKWGQHDDGDRAARIIAAAGVPAGVVDAGVVQVLPQLEPATIAQLMDSLTDSTGGAFVEQLTGNVDYHDAEHRRDQAVGLVLDAGEIVNDLQWEQHVGDVLNELEVTYGQPQARLQVIDHYSVDELDPFAGTLNTILVDASDAHSIGSRLVARRAWPAWQLPGLLVQLHKRPDVKLAQLLGLKHGDRIKVTGVPAGPHPYAGDVEFFVEGLAETATKQAWRMAIAVSDPARAGVDIRWIDVPAGLTWSGVDPTLTWRDVALIQNPADLEA